MILIKCMGYIYIHDQYTVLNILWKACISQVNGKTATYNGRNPKRLGLKSLLL